MENDSATVSGPATPPRKTTAAGAAKNEFTPEAVRSAVESAKKLSESLAKNQDGENGSVFIIQSMSVNQQSGGNTFHGEIKTGGDFVAGNKILSDATKTASRARGIAGYILETQISEIQQVYVHAGNEEYYRQAETILTTQHLLILHGNKGGGKNATAVHLLAQCLAQAQVETIFVVDPTLKRLPAFESDAQQLYLLEAPSASLNLVEINQVQRQLQTQNSYLVITLAHEALKTNDDLLAFSLRWPGVLDKEAVLRQHLTRSLGDSQQLQIEALCQEAKVGEQLQHLTALARVRDLAQVLVRVAKQEMELALALEQFGTHLEREVEECFERHPHLTHIALLLALAVLHEIKEEVVFDVGYRLQQLLAEQLGGRKELDKDPALALLGVKKSDLLNSLQVLSVPGQEQTAYGLVPVELLTFAHPQYPNAILGHFWRERVQWRKPLLAWLVELGTHRNATVRLKAAQAVGCLSRYAFDTIRAEVLTVWAHSPMVATRRLVGAALTVPLLAGELTAQVLGLLHHWATLRDNFDFQHTVTLAYCSGIGLLFPDKALRDLKAVAQSNNILLFFDLVNTFLGLFEAAHLAPTTYLAILQALLEWSEEKKDTMTYHVGLITFCGLLQLTEANDDTDKTENPSWPLLLRLFVADETYRTALVVLVRRALASTKNPIALVADALCAWLKLSAEDEKLYKALRLLIYRLLVVTPSRQDAATAQRLFHYLLRWRSLGESQAELLLTELGPYLPPALHR